MQRVLRFAAVCGFVVVFAGLLAGTATAHERRELGGGQYEVVVGFIDEPAFVGEKNGLYLRVGKIGAATPAAGGEGAEEAAAPVLGLDQTLTAEVIYGDQTLTLPLTPAFDEPGSYESVFFPMAEGDYTFRLSGQIEGTAIDESFTSSPEGFDSVQAREPLEFPKPS